ncbi:thermonuclease family protein [Cytobacillus sp. FJAT-54145]|uniref:Thermonuclease family protein n=1 Tax=Cytobacillus spartinae TaxID=3299023 RepID=A0ABW6KES7_9BACI
MQLGRHLVMFFTIFILLLQLNSTSSLAHNGGRDELGGHFRNSNCTYLLHEPTALAKEARSIEELLRLIQQYNSNTKCVSNLTIDKIDLEGYNLENIHVSSPVSQSTTDLILGEKYVAILEKCTDGDTANFNVNGTTYKTRFLYIDTPESTNQIEPYGKEASEYTCEFLKKGKITLETDGNTLFDKYDRLLAWVWVDGLLHQEEITKAGLVEDFYDYGNYKYEERIISAMKEAKEVPRGMYAMNKDVVDEDVTEHDQKEVNQTPLDETSNDSEGTSMTLILFLGGLIAAFVIILIVKFI